MKVLGGRTRPASRFSFDFPLRMPPTCAELLEAARRARAAGDAHECLLSAQAAHAAACDAGDCVTGWHALAAQGRLFFSAGDPTRARGYYLTALGYVHANGTRELYGGAAHDLYLCARELRDVDGMRRWLPMALEGYPPRSPRVSGLIADMAWANVADRPEDAVETLRGALIVLSAPRERMCAYALLASAFAYLGNRAAFVATWGKLLCVEERLDTREGYALACADAAEGALRMGENGRAGEIAARGRAAAVERRELALADRLAFLADEAAYA